MQGESKMTQTSQSPAGIVVRAARVVPARPEEVYRLLTDPTLMPKWWGKTEKCTLFACDMDVHRGGRFRYGIRSEKGDEDVISGSYLEVVPPSKLAFTWSSENPNDGISDTRVTVDLCDLKDGTTRGVITHEGLPSPHAATVHSAGWHNILQDMSLHVVRS
jgi:uncharacterized protein YndB with AHSA1/START domain